MLAFSAICISKALQNCVESIRCRHVLRWIGTVASRVIEISFTVISNNNNDSIYLTAKHCLSLPSNNDNFLGPSHQVALAIFRAVRAKRGIKVSAKAAVVVWKPNLSTKAPPRENYQNHGRVLKRCWNAFNSDYYIQTLENLRLSWKMVSILVYFWSKFSFHLTKVNKTCPTKSTIRKHSKSRTCNRTDAFTTKHGHH